MPATYKLKLSCANCGMRGFYEAPMGAEFWPMEANSILPTYDGSHLMLPDESKKELRCDNCGMACLSVSYWEGPTIKHKKSSAVKLLPAKVGTRG